jgi:hypothetical protein
MDVTALITDIADGAGIRPIEAEEGCGSRMELGFPAPEPVVLTDNAAKWAPDGLDRLGIVVLSHPLLSSRRTTEAAEPAALRSFMRE